MVLLNEPLEYREGRNIPSGRCEKIDLLDLSGVLFLIGNVHLGLSDRL
jgi:hypothetical protein